MQAVEIKLKPMRRVGHVVTIKDLPDICQRYGFYGWRIDYDSVGEVNYITLQQDEKGQTWIRVEEGDIIALREDSQMFNHEVDVLSREIHGRTMKFKAIIS